MLALAISQHGVLNYMLLKGEDMDGATYAELLEHYILPQLDPLDPRVILHDNLTSHTAPEALAIQFSSPHIFVTRAAYCCMDAPIENPFFFIKSYLRRNTYVINEGNLRWHIEQSISLITPALCLAWFRRSYHGADREAWRSHIF